MVAGATVRGVREEEVVILLMTGTKAVIMEAAAAVLLDTLVMAEQEALVQLVHQAARERAEVVREAAPHIALTMPGQVVAALECWGKEPTGRGRRKAVPVEKPVTEEEAVDMAEAEQVLPPQVVAVHTTFPDPAELYELFGATVALTHQPTQETFNLSWSSN